MPASFIAIILLTASLGQADCNAWLGPAPPGNRYPVGEEDRQYAILADDLGHREAFRRVAAQTLRPEASIVDSDRDPLDILLRRTEALLATSAASRTVDLRLAAAELAAIRAKAAGTAVQDRAARRSLFDDACHVRRRIALANPLLDFKDILFVKRQRSCFNHMRRVLWHHPTAGWRPVHSFRRPGPESETPRSPGHFGRQQRPFEGRKLSGGPRRSWNLYLDFAGNLHGEETRGDRFFPPVSPTTASPWPLPTSSAGAGANMSSTPIFARATGIRVPLPSLHGGSGGGNLRQISDGTWNDFDPRGCPAAALAFISERRGDNLRCGSGLPHLHRSSTCSPTAATFAA